MRSLQAARACLLVVGIVALTSQTSQPIPLQFFQRRAGDRSEIRGQALMVPVGRATQVDVFITCVSVRCRSSRNHLAVSPSAG